VHEKGAASIRNIFGGLKNALQSVYPEVNFDKWYHGKQ